MNVSESLTLKSKKSCRSYYLQKFSWNYEFRKSTNENLELFSVNQLKIKNRLTLAWIMILIKFSLERGAKNSKWEPFICTLTPEVADGHGDNKYHDIE